MRDKFRNKGVLAAAIATALTFGTLAGGAQAGVTNKDILKDQETTDDVVSYGLGPRAQRYSPLEAVNTDTVQSLQPVWAFSFGC